MVPLSPTDEAVRNEALADYETALDKGQPPERERWLARYSPPVADDLRAALDDLDRVRMVATRIRTAIDTARRATGAAPGRLGALPVPKVPDYEIRDILGETRMSVVFKAWQTSLKRYVAIKVLLAAELTEEQRERFQREALALARLEHPYIVQVHAFDALASPPYLVLGFVDGGNLHERIQGTPWTEARARVLLTQLAAAVACYHDKGIIHRDLKPANILLRLDGTPMIADFGLAKLFAIGNDDSTQLQTSEGSVLGTPYYMAPEQCGGKGDVGPAADIYALGVILYELVTGRLPFVGTLEQVVGAKLAAEPPPPPSQLRPGLSPSLDRICAKCLRRDPAERYASADALRADLECTSRAPTSWRHRRAAMFAAALLLAGLFATAVWWFQPPQIGPLDPVKQPGPAAAVKRPFYPLHKALAVMLADLKTAQDPTRRRYLTLANLESDTSLSTDELDRFRGMLAKLGPSGRPWLWPVDRDAVVYALQLPDEDRQPDWPAFLANCPYTLRLDAGKDETLANLDRDLQDITKQPRPFMRADWFVRQVVHWADKDPGWLTANGPIPTEVRDWVAAWEKRPIGLPTAAAELDVSDPADLPAQIAGNPRLAKTLNLAPLAAGGTVSRQTWESAEFSVSPFQEFARVLKLGAPVSE